MTISYVNQFSNYSNSNKSLFLCPKSKKISHPRLNYTITIPDTLVETVFKRVNPSITAPSSHCLKNSVKGEMGAEQALLGPLVLNGADLIKDFSGHIRKGFDSSKIIYGTENPIALAALGFTSGFSLISGGLSIKGGIEDERRARKISDATGRSLGYLRIAKGGVQSAAGALYIPARALTIASLATSSKVYATAAGVFGSTAGGCLNILSIISSISIALCLDEQYKFYKQLDGILSDPSEPSEDGRYIRALEFLKQLATVSPEEKAEIGQTIASNEKYRLLNPEQIAEKTAKKEQKLLRKKEAYLKRLTNGDCLNLIRQKGPAEAKFVIESVQKKCREKVIMASVALVLIAIGLALLVSSFFLGPVGLMVISALGLATSLSWVVMDVYALMSNFNASDPGRFDKLLIFISTVAAVISVSLVFFFSAGIAPIVAASVVGVVWLGINSLCYYRIYQFEKKALLANPNLSLA